MYHSEPGVYVTKPHPLFGGSCDRVPIHGETWVALSNRCEQRHGCRPPKATDADPETTWERPAAKAALESWVTLGTTTWTWAWAEAGAHVTSG